MKRATCGDDQALTICSPKPDGTYIVEFRTAAGESLAISVPGTEAALLKHFQARMPYGLVVPAMDNVDRAAKHLQDLAGIATGDVASHYLNEEKWAGADRTARVKLLQEWLKAEVLYEE